ncbi:olfactory receptor 10G2-like [Caloenas nicobarica]|uniref:olfactory receptor 10G2-like n=1 Tax=Caloenas nicobarica TaxID=187106 RepID=UPI0032B7D182
MTNYSSITQFLLLPFTDTRELQLLHFWLFLGIYLAALLGNGLIPGCVAQVFLFAISAECALLTIMSYNPYVAICKPLHYGTLLGSRACVHMAAAAWGTEFLNALPHMANIFRAVLRIPSEQGRHKAFSTCVPHLTVVSLFVNTGLDLLVSVLYSVVPPAVNPLIYSMRNQELKVALKKVIQSFFCQQQ